MPLVRVFLSHKPDCLDIAFQAACENHHIQLISLLLEVHHVQDWTGGFLAACDGDHRDIGELMIALAKKCGARYRDGELVGRCRDAALRRGWTLSLIHISEPTRQA